MRDNPDPSGTASSSPHHGRPASITNHRRSSGVAVLVATAAVALAASTATSPSHAASLAKRGATGRHAAEPHASRFVTDDAAGPLEQWAACERAHGDPGQADPTVEHQVIDIAVPMGALANWDPTDATAACGSYLADARRAVAGGRPVAGWGDNALQVRYANCMRAHGYPTFPYPSGKIEPDGNESTDFNGTGIDPSSPAFLNGNANQTCGKQIGAPAWWIDDWGPPGSVDVYPAGTNPNDSLPPGANLPFIAKPGVCGAPGPQVPRGSGSVTNAPATAAW